MRKTVTVFTLAAVLAVLLAAGCNGSAKQKAAKGKPQVALVMKSLANEFFKTMEDGALEHQKAGAGKYDLICNGINNEQDVNKQIEIVNQMIARRVDAIVIAPADSKALIAACRKAKEKGIVVVNIDNKFDAETLKQEGVAIPFVGPDNRKGARLAGDHLAKQLKKGDKVAIVEGIPGAFNAVQRQLGFEDAMKAAGVEIATSQSAHWETDRAYKLVSQIYIKFGAELKAVLCANDSMALGAANALKGKGVLVAGFDNISAVQELIKEGRVVCTVDQHADRIAVNGIEYALEIIRTGRTPQDKETPVDLVTAESLR
jgi:ribose transport system substrate-binding protein